MTADALLVLPFTRPPLQENQRLHFRVRTKIVREIATAVQQLAVAHRIPRRATHCTVGLLYYPPDRVRRDADNLVPTLKAVCDALAGGSTKYPGHGLVPDDTPDLMTKTMPVIGQVQRPGQVVIPVSWVLP